MRSTLAPASPDRPFALRKSSPRRWRHLAAGAAALLCMTQAFAVPLPAPTSFSIDNPSVVLSGGPNSTGTVTFTVTRSNNIGSAASVEFTTVQDGNAVPGDDYTPIPLTLLSFPAGTASETIPVSVAVGEPAEKAETFGIQLSAGPANNVIGGSPVQLNPATGCSSLMGAAVGDLNGDGKPDLVVACQSGKIAGVYLNTTAPGSATSSFSGPYVMGTGFASAVAIADINGDGIPDVITSNYSGVTLVFINNTAANAVMPSFAAPVAVAGIAAHSGQDLAVADINGDGKPDIVSGNATNDVYVALNTTPTGSTMPSFSAPVSLPTGNNFSIGVYGVTIGDLNRDGIPDIAAASFGGAVTVFLNETPPGSSTASFLLPAANMPLGHREYSAVIGDIDGDGVPDLTLVGPDGPLTFLRNLTPPGATTLTFAPEVDYNVGGEPTALAIGDIDGDGRLDIVLSDYVLGGTLLLNATPAGSTTPSFLQPQIRLNTGAESYYLAIGDFNGDGLQDIAVTDYGGSSAVSIFTSQSTGPAPVFTSSLGVATLIIPDASGATGSSGASGGASSGSAGTGGSSTAPASGGGGAADPGLLTAWLGLALLGRARAARRRTR